MTINQSSIDGTKAIGVDVRRRLPTRRKFMGHRGWLSAILRFHYP